MNSDREDTWCCFGGHPIKESMTLIQGSAGAICSECVENINENLKRAMFGKLPSEFPFLSACLTPKLFAMMALTDENGLSNPTFIRSKIISSRFTSTMDFLELIMRMVSEQSESACYLHDGFKDGLVHILHENKPLCGFTQNGPLQWPKSQTPTTEEKNFEGLSCSQCQFLALEKFPNHPAFAN